MSSAALIAALMSTGSVFFFNDTISSDVGQYDVATQASAAGWNGTDVLAATITIASGGRCVSTAPGTAGFTTGTLPAKSTVDLTIQSGGEIFGAGGDGGDGGIGTGGSSSSGQNGGSAVDFECDGTITVDAGTPNGEISGGGGGGGGGGAADSIGDQGGGGGGGFPNGAPGSGGTGATAGTDAGGGSGGTAEANGGDGGNGGNEAANGATGQNGAGSSGSIGGTAGSAIEKNGNTVTVTNNGTINGAINA